MRSLIRTRTLAALCALLLVFASLANANAPARPIDRPEGPPELDPTMVGDPDAGHGGLMAYWRQLIVAAQLSNPQLRAFALPMLRARSAGARSISQLRVRGR